MQICKQDRRLKSSVAERGDAGPLNLNEESNSSAHCFSFSNQYLTRWDATPTNLTGRLKNSLIQTSNAPNCCFRQSDLNGLEERRGDSKIHHLNDVVFRDIKFGGLSRGKKEELRNNKSQRIGRPTSCNVLLSFSHQGKRGSVEKRKGC